MAGTRPLNEQEQIAVVESLGKFPPRDKALVQLMLNLGFRISELLALNLGHVWEQGRIRPRVKLHPARLKGGRGLNRRAVASRTVILNQSAITVLQEYLFSVCGSERPANPAMPLFKSRKGGRLSRWQANRVIHEVVAAAGIDAESRGELSSHALRKTFCSNIYRASGKDIHVTMAVMGHRYVTTTQLYLLSRQEDVENAILAIGTMQAPPAETTALSWTRTSSREAG